MPRNPRQAIYDVDTSTYRIPLTKGQFAIVDLDDVAFLTRGCWHAKKPGTAETFYAEHQVRVGSKQVTVGMHRELAVHWGWDVVGCEVDHIDGCGLNNRRTNLRVVSRSQNIQNSKRRRNSASCRKGVSVYRNKWAAYIWVDGRNLLLGVFVTVAEAAAAYENASMKYFGEYGRTDSGSNLTRQPS